MYLPMTDSTKSDTDKVISFCNNNNNEYSKTFAFEYLANCENPSQYLDSDGKIDVFAILRSIDDDMRKKILENHPYEVKYLESIGRWQTYVPDDTCKNGRRQLRRAKREDLESDLITHYKRINAGKLVTIEKVAYEWLELKRSEPGFKSSSYDRYENQYLRIFGDKGKKLRIRSISESFLVDYLLEIIISKGITMRIWSDMKTVLRGIFKFAKRKGYTEIHIEDVLDAVSEEKKAFSKAKKRTDSDEVFTDEEVEKIETYILGRGSISLVDYGILLAFQSGLRAGELCALKHADFDVENYKLNISRTEQHSKGADGHVIYYFSDEGYLKCDHPAETIFITEKAIKLYHKIKEQNPNSEYLFCTDHFIRGQAFTKRLCYICGKVGIKPRGLHKARKTYATRLINGGASDIVVQKQLRHIDIATTKRYYYFDNMPDAKKLEEVKKAVGHY